MEKISGVKQYAYSNGWKQASNSLYIYEHYYKNEHINIPLKFRELDSAVRDYFNKPHQSVNLLFPDQEITLGSYYMAVGGTPLYKYMQQKSGYKNWSLDFNRTAPYGSFFKEYGDYLIFHHPIGYIKYVIYPHMVSYLTPYLEIYTVNTDAFLLWTDQEYGQVVRNWFKISTTLIPDKYIKLRGWLLSPYPFVYTVIHLFFIFALIFFIILKSFKSLSRIRIYSIITLVLMCIGNFVFTIISTTSVIRYQQAIIGIEFSLSVYLIETILLLERKRYPN